MRHPHSSTGGERRCYASAMRFRPRLAGVAAVAVALAAPAPRAQDAAAPKIELFRAPTVTLPGRIDSNNPLVWHREGATAVLSALTSWGGVPEVSRGPAVDRLRLVGQVAFTSHPGHGVWFEAVVPDAQGLWYGFYHHERPADDCGRPERQLPRIGLARSVDQGRSWTDLGIVLDAPAGTAACESTNRFTLGGVGDVSAVLDREERFVYLYASHYGRVAAAQGVFAARLAWADRDEPAGKVEVWSDGVWLPPRDIAPRGQAPQWDFPVGTSLWPPTRPFHDGQTDADVFWGPSIHWNTYLERYVMLLNRAGDEQYAQDGIYVSYAASLDQPRAWSRPSRLIEGGEWYPQAVGLDPGTGTDRLAGRYARLFVTGRSSLLLRFER